MSKAWSPMQLAIFTYIAEENGNAIIEAVAGSGKSTTIVEGTKRVPQGKTSIFLAFNKGIADELKSRGVNARTFHSLCYSPVMQAKGTKQVEMDKLRKLCKSNMKGDDERMYGQFCCKLVGLARQVGIGCLVQDTEQAWMDICVYHDLEPESELADLGRGIALARELLDWSNASPMVDFDDMLYMAVKDGISLPKFDVIFVDEAQDTNAIQRAILRKIMRGKTARIIAVGDPAQAIYGFRGADSESLNILREEFDCKVLPLSVTYRCPLSVVAYAQQWVPHIQAAPDAPEGMLAHLGTKWKPEEFLAGDLVVCRKTAPLVQLAYRCIRARKPVTLLGREIGQGLKALVNKMNANGLAALEKKLEAYREREVEKALAAGNEAKAEAVGDKVDSLLFLVDSLEETQRTVPALLARVDELFADKAGAVVLATIHKSKGLEATNVYWLGRSECPARWARQEWQKQQEINLCYVATTRAKAALYTIELAE